jgi:hypothetical protein
MNSIQRQLTFGLLVGLVIISVACGAALYFYVRQELTRQFDEGLRGKAGTFAALSNQREEDEEERRVLLENLPTAARNTISQHAEGAVVTEIELVIREGRLFYKVEVIRNGLETEFLLTAAGQ